MARQLPSRLARRQGKKIIRQSAFTLILALVGSLLFLFVVMPQLVQLFFRFFGSGDLNFRQEDTVPPQVPIITPPPEATRESSYLIEGFGEAESQIVVVRNGEEIGSTAVNQEGSFSYTLELAEGENTVDLYGKDEAGNKSASRSFIISLDAEAPSLAFEDLEDGKSITLKENQTLQIRGETEPGSQLVLNERNIYVNSDGTFSTSYYLQEGDNTLQFVVTDAAGNRSERNVRVTFHY